MENKLYRKRIIKILLYSFCVSCLVIFGYSQYKIYATKAEFNEILRVVDENVPPMMCELLNNDPLMESVDVTIESSVVPEKYHDWYSWIENCVVVFRVSDSFDALPLQKQYEFIDICGDNVPSVKRNATNQLAPLHNSYSIFSSKDNNMLKKIYGQAVFHKSNYDVYIKTSMNTYKYCENTDELIIVNGKDVWVHRDPSEYLIDAPYVGMDASDISKTKLGSYSKSELCRDYYVLRPDHRSVTYYWCDSTGNTLFKAYALAGEVISTTDFRSKRIVSHGPNDKQ